MKQAFLKDVSEIFQLYVYDNNQKVVPTSADIVIYKPGTSEELIGSTAMSIASDGLLYYTLSAVANDTSDLNYKAVVSYVVLGITYATTLFYDVVRSKLHMVITDDDVINELPQIKDKGWRVHGTADSGSTTTIVDNALKRYDDDYFTGGLATSLTLEETQRITNFVQSNGIVTTEPFGNAISTDKYMLQRSFGNEIQRAFDKIIGLLIREGRFQHLILDSHDLSEVHIMFTIAEICKGFVTETGGMWWEFWQDYKKTSFSMYKALNLKYDTSDDGFIAGAEEKKRFKRRIGRG